MELENAPRAAARESANARLLEDLKKKYPKVDPQALETSVTLMEVAAQKSLIEEQLYGTYNLSRGRFEILLLLTRQPDRTLAPSKLSELAGVSRATMTQFLDVLERDGLITRKANPIDRRAIVVALTPKGEILVAKVLPKHFEWIGRLVQSLTTAERSQFLTLLTKVKKGMEGLV